MVTKRINVSVPEDLAEAIERYRLSPSALLQDAVRGEAERREALQRNLGDITVELADRHNENIYDATFVGRWLVEPDPDETRADPTDGPGWDAGAYYGVAVTAKGQFAVYVAHCNERWAPNLTTYAALEDVEGQVPASVYRQVDGAVTGTVRLDI